MLAKIKRQPLLAIAALLLLSSVSALAIVATPSTLYADSKSACANITDVTTRGFCVYSYDNPTVPEVISCKGVKDGYTKVSGGQAACEQGKKAAADEAAKNTNPADPNQTAAPGSGGASGAQTSNEDGTTCAVEKIGWILCPVIEGAATMSDKVFDFLAGHFLETEPELLDNNSGTKQAWEQARNLANILFIIAFVVIVYSQITGAGISNYGIKRMLPRLIIAAILVNVSYYICQAMVDLSNILGYNLKVALETIANNAGPSILGHSAQGVDTQTSGGNLSKIAIAVLAAAGLVWIAMAPMGMILLMILITCLTIIIILLLRKAFIVLLVVMSPIAFVAYLLPNTEKYFSKWLNMFWQLLMVFPIVALLIGGGQLASSIILTAGVDNTTANEQQAADCDSAAPENQRATNGGYSIPCEGKIDVGQGKQAGWMLGLVAAGIAVAPLLAVWAVLKGALAAAGAIGGKIGSAVQRGTDKSGRGMAGAYKNSNFGKYRASKKQEKRGRIATGSYAGSNPINKLRSRANRSMNQSGAFNRVTSGYGAGRDLLAQAQDAKDMKDTEAFFNHDEDLMKAWLKQSTVDEHGNSTLDAAQLQQYNRMKNSGMTAKPISFLAAAEGLSDSGKGSAEDIVNALKKAKGAGASATAISSALENAKANYRKSGRGDALGALNHVQSVAGGAQQLASSTQGYNDMAAATQDSTGNAIPTLHNTQVGAWGQVTPGSAHREGVTGSSYRDFVAGSKGNVEKALQGYNSMEGRAQTSAAPAILAAANRHSPGANFQTIQEAKNAYNIR